MTLYSSSVSSIKVGKLLDQKLGIPHYQRLYSWEPATALQLLDDIEEARKDGERREIPYVLGAMILHADGPNLEVVDGQQRPLTLRTILLLSETVENSRHHDHADNPIGRVRTALRREPSRTHAGTTVRARSTQIEDVTGPACITPFHT